jgi:ribonuclease P protein component
MIASRHRFHSGRHIQHIYAKGAVERGDGFAFRFVVSKNNTLKLAVVVSKKVAARAVDRNRIRRRVYDALFLAFSMRGPDAVPLEMVCVVFAPYLKDQAFAELLTSMRTAVSTIDEKQTTP